MKQVKVTEFRAHLPEYLRKAQNGETITLLSRRQPAARLDPGVPALEFIKLAISHTVGALHRLIMGEPLVSVTTAGRGSPVKCPPSQFP